MQSPHLSHPLSKGEFYHLFHDAGSAGSRGYVSDQEIGP